MHKNVGNCNTFKKHQKFKTLIFLRTGLFCPLTKILFNCNNTVWIKVSQSLVSFLTHTVFLGENVIQIAKMQSSVATNLHFFSILFYNKSQKWKILATLGLFWCMQSGYIAGCIQKSVDSSLCLIGLIVFLRSLMVLLVL